MKKIKFNARFVAWTAVFAALAAVLQLLEFHLPVLPTFLAVDFSELPAVLASFSLGPTSGVLVCLVKNLIKLITTTTGGVGELANFLIGIFYVIPAGLIYKYRHTFGGAVIGMLVGIVCCGLISVPLNYYITYPVYYNFMAPDAILGMYRAIYPGTESILQALFIFNLPMTACKMLVNSAITLLVYKKLSNLIKFGFKRKKKAVPAQTAAGNVGCAQIGEKTSSTRTASRCPFCGADLDAKNADECPYCKTKFVAENKPGERKEDK